MSDSGPKDDSKPENITDQTQESKPRGQVEQQVSSNLVTSQSNDGVMADDRNYVTSTATAKNNGQFSTTSQNVFAGKTGAGSGMMCSNLKSNPFSIGSDHGLGGPSSAILAKPKFSLKPSQFSGAKGDATSTISSSTSNTNSNTSTGINTTNPFLRPAKLNYDSDDADHTNVGSTAETKNDQKEDSDDDNKSAKSAVLNDGSLEGNSQVQSTSDAAITVTATTAATNPVGTVSSTTANTIGLAYSETFGSFGQNLATFSDASTSSFVFGEQINDRVTNSSKENGATNGYASESEKPKIQTVDEAVVEYRKQQEIGPSLPEVETKTGEEEESNVLQINCKLFLFNEKEKSWAEKGRGCLRLNDTEGKKESQSRMVMRTIGIHRVILNTSVWPSMLCERASSRSIRITGTDNENEVIHVYLITGAVGDVDHLYNALTYRLQHMKHSQASAAAIADNEPDVSHASPNSVSASPSAPGATSKRKTSDDDGQLEWSPKKTKTEDGVEESASKEVVE